MESKVVYTDNGVDKAIVGEITREDENIIVVQSKGQPYWIGKNRIVCVKPRIEGDSNVRKQ